MVNERDINEAVTECGELLKRAGVTLSASELKSVEVADFGLNDYRCEGAQIITLVSTNRVGLKIICLFPGQTLPEHWHAATDGYEGKEETVRVIYGALRVYLPGGDGPREGFIPKHKDDCYTCRREVCLRPAEQATIPPGVKHWFQAGGEGAVAFSISSMATCAADPFTDPNIVRMPAVAADGGART